MNRRLGKRDTLESLSSPSRFSYLKVLSSPLSPEPKPSYLIYYKRLLASPFFFPSLFKSPLTHQSILTAVDYGPCEGFPEQEFRRLTK